MQYDIAERCKHCGECVAVNYYGICEECWDIPEVRLNAALDDAAERKMAAKETERQDDEYRRTHDGWQDDSREVR